MNGPAYLIVKRRNRITGITPLRAVPFGDEYLLLQAARRYARSQAARGKA